MNLHRFFHTIRYLKPVQIYGRFFYRIYRPKPDRSKAPERRDLSAEWISPIAKRPSLSGPCRFRFLNEEHEVAKPEDWNHPDWDKLWLYNLHYFDDLTAENAANRSHRHQQWMDRWIRENPPGTGNGWEPYPTSLRIVNWIKWLLTGNTHYPSLITDSSLAIQTRYLSKRLEHHLLGNHLFANAKALVFAGLFFVGKEADAWLNKGLKILSREIPEQILADGGHFERSPMYHATILEDLLDLINMTRAYADAIPVKWRSFVDGWPGIAQRMQMWLKAMCHPDGEIAFFNDAAMGIAPEPQALMDYARRLTVGSLDDVSGQGITALTDTGYIRMQKGAAAVILDVGAIGPDYLPGHAHADTLSFELSLFGRRVLVNSGISCYGTGAERLRQRGTAAHNTVTVDEQDSSEVWSGFRVARRACVTDCRTETTDDTVRIHAAHDGYRRLKTVGLHHRTWELTRNELWVRDTIEGKGVHEMAAAFHFHPDLRLQMVPSDDAVSDDGVSRRQVDVLDDNGKIVLKVEPDRRLHIEIHPSTWHPEFGRSIPNQVIICRATIDLPLQLTTRFKFHQNS